MTTNSAAPRKARSSKVTASNIVERLVRALNEFSFQVYDRTSEERAEVGRLAERLAEAEGAITAFRKQIAELRAEIEALRKCSTA